MRITAIGHAGFLIEARGLRIVCDPWFTPAYFGSWFPFPSNEHLDLRRITNPTHLYISHLHHDHFDPEFLARHMSKDATVILPDYPLDTLEQELRALGFTSFLKTRNTQPVTVDGVTLMVNALVAPTDGPIGDSALLVDDGETRVLNLNDARPTDLDALLSLGPLDLLLLQFSGAIWYPMVYDFPEKMKQALGKQKRQNQLRRALQYVLQLAPRFTVPCAGPPCFLDDDLFHLNDLQQDPANIFPDQTVFLEYLAQHGASQGFLMIPGSEGVLTPQGFQVAHPLPDEEVQAIFTHKEEYLTAYQARQRPVLARIRASWPQPRADFLPALRAWFEPLMAQTDLTCAGINDNVLLELGDQGIVLDFRERTVRAWGGEAWGYRFRIDPRLVEHCVRHRLEDWVNELFLSCRFQASRRGKYNEYVYNFFKCLSQERMQYAEGYYVEQGPVRETWEYGGYRIQKRCPHLKADLTRFAHIEGDVLTCRLHGWQFRLSTGECLTSDECRLWTRPIAAGEEAPVGEAA
ncbi:MAG: MBL fold metallo-hydrolase [Chloroflexi bacterium]|nr:MBL fold metallo-hydrolase [Chloroflexota bacterium]